MTRTKALLIVGIVLILIFTGILVKQNADFLSKSDSLNAEPSLDQDGDPQSFRDAYQKGVDALKVKDYAEAEKWIRRAALGGIGDAQFILATLYENGFGLPKDGMQACYWYRVAADNKNINAEKALERSIKANAGEESRTWEFENC